jgi:hypothetical protein
MSGKRAGAEDFSEAAAITDTGLGGGFDGLKTNFHSSNPTTTRPPTASASGSHGDFFPNFPFKAVGGENEGSTDIGLTGDAGAGGDAAPPVGIRAGPA